MFLAYDKMIYLDSDTIVAGDISELYLMDMEGMAIAAVEDIGMRQVQYSKKALFIDGKIPYNSMNYRKIALGMKHPENYFNAGVIVFDLIKCRQLYSFQNVADTLHSRQFAYNDQDVLNLLFDGKTKMLDPVWNYQNNVEYYLVSEKEDFAALFKGWIRTSYQIIHYIGQKKPWKETVKLGSYYEKYKDE